jgi:hypothetical protein
MDRPLTECSCLTAAGALEAVAGHKRALLGLLAPLLECGPLRRLLEASVLPDQAPQQGLPAAAPAAAAAPESAAARWRGGWQIFRALNGCLALEQSAATAAAAPADAQLGSAAHLQPPLHLQGPGAASAAPGARPAAAGADEDVELTQQALEVWLLPIVLVPLSMQPRKQRMTGCMLCIPSSLLCY